MTVKVAIVKSPGRDGALGAKALVMFTVLPNPGVPLGVQLFMVFQLEFTEPFQVKVCANISAGKNKPHQIRANTINFFMVAIMRFELIIW